MMDANKDKQHERDHQIVKRLEKSLEIAKKNTYDIDKELRGIFKNILEGKE